MANDGKRTVLDEIKKREILAILAVGCSRCTAAKYVGCAVTTIKRTADRDPEFAEDLCRKENQHEFTYLKNIRQAAEKPQYWRAAAWVLERVFPDKYARRGPDVITIKQISSLLARFAEIIVEEVPVPRYRKNILKRLETLTRGLGGPAAKKEPDDER